MPGATLPLTQELAGEAGLTSAQTHRRARRFGVIESLATRVPVIFVIRTRAAALAKRAFYHRTRAS